MRSLYTTLLLGMAWSLPAQHVQAQSLAAPSVPRVTQPTAPPAVGGPSLNQPALDPLPVPDSPSRRAESAAPIQSVGPAAQVKQAPQQQPPGGQAVRYGTPVEVMDAGGRTIGGAIQVGPNRIYVPSTGKYHNTIPAGQLQRIVP